MCRRIDNWHSDVCWVAFWPEWPLQWNRFVESMNKLECPCLPTPCPNGKLKHRPWPVLLVIQYLQSKKYLQKKKYLRSRTDRFKPRVVREELVEYVGGVDAGGRGLPPLHDLWAHHVQLLLLVMEVVVQATQLRARVAHGEILQHCDRWVLLFIEVYINNVNYSPCSSWSPGPAAARRGCCCCTAARTAVSSSWRGRSRTRRTLCSRRTRNWIRYIIFNNICNRYLISNNIYNIHRTHPRLLRQGQTASACWNLSVQVMPVSSLSFRSSVTLSTRSMFDTK